jgi:hypothetical protein
MEGFIFQNIKLRNIFNFYFLSLFLQNVIGILSAAKIFKIVENLVYDFKACTKIHQFKPIICHRTTMSLLLIFELLKY